MYLDRYQPYGVYYGFDDPVEKKKTKAMMGFPELSKHSCIVYSNDGWLLIKESPSNDVKHFLFNPFTRERINLPTNGLRMATMKFAFSCAPTKKDCLVFGIDTWSVSLYGRVRISTWHLGATTWVEEDFPDVISVGGTRNILYSDGLFYMAAEVSLGVFDASARTWNVLPVQPITIAGVDACDTIRWLTEYKGQIYLVDASSAEPMVFRLNRLESVWEKKETLDGSSIFVSDGSCVMASGLTGSMINVLYFWKRPVKPKVYHSRSPRKFTTGIAPSSTLYIAGVCVKNVKGTIGWCLDPPILVRRIMSGSSRPTTSLSLITHFFPPMMP
ncbi:unnamed protein product [Microthlaspi erraticum]|uniref:KIB1-4 beta-propeller domain-containing protein n=1 Tax=Microthlaspi erraticum TaxID=1685480 RepID=A0A6D2KEU4_9BRAS|nr:unnamed protein product [Microthlaspi erraticum]